MKIRNFDPLYFGFQGDSAAKIFFSKHNPGVIYHPEKFHFETPRTPKNPPLWGDNVLFYLILNRNNKKQREHKGKCFYIWVTGVDVQKLCLEPFAVNWLTRLPYCCGIDAWYLVLAKFQPKFAKEFLHNLHTICSQCPIQQQINDRRNSFKFLVGNCAK